jgi:hypothetical protein
LFFGGENTMPNRAVRVGLLSLAALVALHVNVAEAHHGRNFLIVFSADLPHPREIYLIPHVEIIRTHHGTSVESEPTLIAGITQRMALEIHSHIGREPGDRWRYGGTAPAVHLRLTPPDNPWGVAASFEYEFNHLEGQDNRFESRLVLSRTIGATKFAVNVFAERGGHHGETGHGHEEEEPEDPDHEASPETAWWYAGGIRTRLIDRLDWGVEAQGRLNRTTGHELLVGLYAEPASRVTVNVGAGFGLGREGADFTLRGALVLRLR